MIEPVLVLGAGGHAKVLLDSLTSNKEIKILGLLDIDPRLEGKRVLGYPVFVNEEEILKKYLPSSIKLINGVGSSGSTLARREVYKKFKTKGYDFLSILHPHAYIGQEITLGEGVQIMAHATIQPGCRLGNNVIVNTRASLDHDGEVAHHVHLAPGSLCCGNVTIGEGTHVGCGAVILQGITLGCDCLVAAGAVVIRDVPSGSKIAGIPAEKMERE